MPTITTKDGTEIFYKGLGYGSAALLPPWLAPFRRRLGLPDEFFLGQRVSRHRP